MKFTLSWLKEHLETKATLEEIAATLNRIGLEVEEIFNPGKDLSGFVTAKVEEVGKHPNADKLHVLKVDTGTETFQVVCGAPNCSVGMTGIFAKAGTIIPCTGEALKVGNIRGVESFGMMCSEKELGIGENHDGIIELPCSGMPLGVPADKALQIDPMIEIAITPNRAECLGVRGIARDLAAAGLGTLKELKLLKRDEKFESDVKVSVEDFEACPTYVGRYIKGVNNKAKTPQWIKDRLVAIGLRPISPLVDVTNYINYDQARPLHVFDADKLAGNITVRMAKEGEKFLALDEKEYTLDSKSLGICDEEGVQCLAGIMGGLNKGCTEETQNVFLECALFKPEVIARTGRKFHIDSDSRYRYERYVDPTSNLLGSDYATQLILQTCGGEASKPFVCGSEEFKPVVVYLRPERFKSLVGMDVATEKMTEILEKLGFNPQMEDGKIKTSAPSWRGDIEGEHDLIEEVIRMVGLDNLPAVSLPADGFAREMLTPKQKRTVEVRHELAARGLFEAVTWSFTDSNIAAAFRAKGKEPILLANPIASELNEVRPSVLPNLLWAAKNNIAKGFSDVSLFETGPEFFEAEPEAQRLMASGIRTGNVAKKSWNFDARGFDAFDVKADALAAIAASDGPAESAQAAADAPAYYHPGRSGSLRLGRNVLAYFGEIHPDVLKKIGIKQRVYAFEIFLDNIPEPRASDGKSRRKLEILPLQPVDKDMAFVLDKSVLAADVAAAARNADKENIAEVRLFDVYEGTGLPEGKKSIAVSVTFQPKEKTYTDAELETLMNKVIVSVKAKTGGEIRDK